MTDDYCNSLHDEHARRVLGIREQVRCELPRDHRGLHEGGGIRWATTVDQVMEFCQSCQPSYVPEPGENPWSLPLKVDE